MHVRAQNTSKIDSTVENTTKSGDTAVGITLAFNTVGWQAQNVLFNAIDALLGTQIGTAQPDEVLAYVEDTDVNAFRDVTIEALSKGNITATTGNEATSAAAALYGATGLSTSGVLASNLVNSDAKAYVNYTSVTTKKIVTSGELKVDAEDSASIQANTKMLASATTTNDAGASILNNLSAALLNDYQYTTNSGNQVLNTGDEVRIAPNYLKGAPGGVYIFQGTGGASHDLGTFVLQNPAEWVLLNSTDVVPTGLNVSGSDAIGVGVLVVRNDVRSAVQSKVTNATVQVGSAEVDAVESARIEAYAESVAIASGGSAFGTGTVIAGNGAATTNLVLSGSDAFITGSQITTTTGNLKVDARNTSAIDATTLSSTTSGDTGVGVALAFNTVGWQAENLISSALDALIGRPLDDFDHLSSEIVSGLQINDRVKSGATVYRYIGDDDYGIGGSRGSDVQRPEQVGGGG